MSEINEKLYIKLVNFCDHTKEITFAKIHNKLNLSYNEVKLYIRELMKNKILLTTEDFDDLTVIPLEKRLLLEKEYNEHVQVVFNEMTSEEMDFYMNSYHQLPLLKRDVARIQKNKKLDTKLMIQHLEDLGLIKEERTRVHPGSNKRLCEDIYQMIVEKTTAVVNLQKINESTIVDNNHVIDESIDVDNNHIIDESIDVDNNHIIDESTDVDNNHIINESDNDDIKDNENEANEENDDNDDTDDNDENDEYDEELESIKRFLKQIEEDEKKEKEAKELEAKSPKLKIATYEAAHIFDCLSRFTETIEELHKALTSSIKLVAKSKIVKIDLKKDKFNITFTFELNNMCLSLFDDGNVMKYILNKLGRNEQNIYKRINNITNYYGVSLLTNDIGDYILRKSLSSMEVLKEQALEYIECVVLILNSYLFEKFDQ